MSEKKYYKKLVVILTLIKLSESETSAQSNLIEKWHGMLSVITIEIINGGAGFTIISHKYGKTEIKEKRNKIKIKDM